MDGDCGVLEVSELTAARLQKRLKANGYAQAEIQTLNLRHITRSAYAAKSEGVTNHQPRFAALPLADRI